SRYDSLARSSFLPDRSTLRKGPPFCRSSRSRAFHFLTPAGPPCSSPSISSWSRTRRAFSSSCCCWKASAVGTSAAKTSHQAAVARASSSSFFRGGLLASTVTERGSSFPRYHILARFSIPCSALGQSTPAPEVDRSPYCVNPAPTLYPEEY